MYKGLKMKDTALWEIIGGGGGGRKQGKPRQIWEEEKKQDWVKH